MLTCVPSGLDHVLAKVRLAGPNILLWGCPWRKTSRKPIGTIQQERQDFLNMLQNYKSIAKEVQALGGKIAIEWGMGVFAWKDKLVKKLFDELGLAPISIHSCVLGLSGLQGHPSELHWTLHTDCEEINEAFRGCVCEGDDVHPHHDPPSPSSPAGIYMICCTLHSKLMLLSMATQH